MLVALLVVPWFLRRLGQERFGVLSLVWVVVGYFSFLDMGLGRAVTVAVAPLRAADRADHERDIIGAASTLLGSIGLTVMAVLGAALALWGLPAHIAGDALRAEATTAAWLMLPAIPLLLLSSVLRGHLEGVGAFAALNIVRTASGVLLVLGPLLAAMVTPDLVWACAAILLVRAATLAGLIALVAGDMRLSAVQLMRTLVWGGHRAWLGRLLSFGTWATVSNVVGPIIVYVDRFIIAGMLTAGAVALYAVPFDVVSRLPVIVAALCSVLLPELARLAATPGNISSRQIVSRSTAASLVAVIPIVIVAIIATPYALSAWLGADFARQSTGITRVLLLAFGINALAQIPFTALQGSGHARAVALVHLAEIVPYVALVVWAVGSHGLIGAAWAWTLRGAIDYAALAYLWNRLAPKGA
jgi:O-antigen/teichoic acid export membrane protein